MVAYFDLCLSYDNKFKGFWFDFQTVNNMSFFQWLVTNPSVSLGVTLNTKRVIDILLYNFQQYPVNDAFFGVIASAYAVQVAEKRLNPNEKFSINENINLFYLPHVDTGHTLWLEQMKLTGRIKNGKIKLKYVALGLNTYKSLCLAEFLQGLIGYDNLNAVLLNLGITQKNYFVASSLLVFENFNGLNQTAYIQQISNYNQTFIAQRSREIHAALLNDPNSDLRKSDQFLLSAQIQQIVQGKLMTALAVNYLELMGKFNSESYFNKKEKKVIRQIISPLLMETQFGQLHFKSGGFIQDFFSYPNTTNNSFTSTAYATLKDGN